MKFLLIVLLLLPLTSFAKEDLALSKDDVLSRIDSGTLNFSKSFALPLEDKDKNGKTVKVPQDMLIARLKQKNPSLKEEYLYYMYLRTNKWEYSVFYEWYSRKCVLRISEFTRKDGYMEYKASEMMMKGAEIPVKYCEKLYGIKIK